MIILFACILDLILGDPGFPPHPVVIMGGFIRWMEKGLRSIFPKSSRGELVAGAILAVVLPVGTFCFSGGLLYLCYRIHPWLGVALNTFWCYQCLAIRSMLLESRNVYRTLQTENLEASQQAVGRIVGRDTHVLGRTGVVKATVETVAENFSDGVMAPLFFMMLGGAPLALMYKSVNTMDSMIGYKNDRYLYFGRVAAHMDDVCGFFPARLGAFLMMISSGLCGASVSGAFRIWWRDRYHHASPNSAQTESVIAGAFGVQLAGEAFYFGKRYDKPYIGDATNEIVPEHILRVNRIFLVSSLLATVLCALVRWKLWTY
ncbi:MAG: adenosylcobinamide-phosphate synthase CbiB [Lachnospiraceae bacterium]|nr:adenosylcobinamide-phosphate synthase CbiB [Lachnospiraceae bacterium]